MVCLFGVAGAWGQGVGGVGGLAGLSGDVEGVGFDQTFRPGVWTPLVVRVRAESGRSGTYQIRVEQEDLDRDVVSFVRVVSLTGGGGDQRFVVYFLPQGVRTGAGRGLPDRTQGSRLDQLNAVLRVWLCDEGGRKLALLPVRSMVGNVEGSERTRGSRLVLYVREGTSTLARRDLSEVGSLVGMTEDVAIVEVVPGALPAGAAGYAGVDAVIWGAGAPPDRAVSGEAARYRALREWVVGGGRLVVMQASDWRLTAAWGDWLPVRYVGSGEGNVRLVSGLEVLRSLAGDPAVAGVSLGGEGAAVANWEMWGRLPGPHAYGVTRAVVGAVVEEWWSSGEGREGGERYPWLARHGLGAGVVSYVAQDLGSPLLVPRRLMGGAGSGLAEGASGLVDLPGWARVWVRVLDYREAPTVVTGAQDPAGAAYRPSRTVFELGGAILQQMEMGGRAGALIAVAAVFFLVYWAAAGPGLWALLGRRGKREWNWLGFAVVAGGATLLTVVVVRVVLWGGPEARHFTVVRVAEGEVARVESRVGLYVPRDGEVRVALPAGSPVHLSGIGPYAIHPGHAGVAEEFASPSRYEVEVREVAGTEEVGVEIPFRSTLKRLQTSWSGELEGRVVGTVAVPPRGNRLLTGLLVNQTGQALRNVYLVYRGQQAPNAGQDRWVYVGTWAAGEQLRLEELTDLRQMRRWGLEGEQPERWAVASAGGGRVVGWGLMGLPGREFEVERWLRAELVSRPIMAAAAGFDDSGREVPRGWPLLSLYDRVPVMRNVGANQETRSELLRLNARFLDVSSAVSGGRLVVLAEARGVGMPVPLRVDGAVVAGTGTVIYQFVLPLDRSRELEGMAELEGIEDGGDVGSGK